MQSIALQTITSILYLPCVIFLLMKALLKLLAYVALAILFFLLVTIVGIALKKPDATVPPMSNAYLIVGLFFAAIYGLIRIIKRLLHKEKNGSHQ